jgi:hypothetical protein
MSLAWMYRWLVWREVPGSWFFSLPSWGGFWTVTSHFFLCRKWGEGRASRGRMAQGRAIHCVDGTSETQHPRSRGIWKHRTWLSVSKGRPWTHTCEASCGVAPALRCPTRCTPSATGVVAATLHHSHAVERQLWECNILISCWFVLK